MEGNTRNKTFPSTREKCVFGSVVLSALILILILSHFKSKQFQISLAVSPEILHHTQYEEPGFHSLLRRTMTLPILTTSLIHFFLKVWENVLFNFELGSERV